MIKIRLMNDYKQGPIWVVGEDGVYESEPRLLYDDPVLLRLHNRATELYDSCYSFNTPEGACSFSEEREREIAGEMLEIVTAIRDRLHDTVKDPLVIEDYITPRCKAIK